MKTARHRTREEIIVDILKIIDNKTKDCKKTNIMFRANLRWESINRYLDFMIGSNLIVPSDSKDHPFMLTDKGLDFINFVNNNISLLKMWSD